jgi:hypothetical protein
MRVDNSNTAALQGYETYVATSCLTKNYDTQGPGVSGAWNMYFKLFQMKDIYDNATTENGDITPPSTPVDISLSMSTKQFNVGLSHRFKRLMHWGVDCYTGRTVTGTLLPQSVNYQVSWNNLVVYHWHELGTWKYPVTNLPSISQVVLQDSAKQIKFIRFAKSLRFRLLKFKLDFVTRGNNSDGPVRIYSITAFIASKQLTPKAVN